MMDWQLLTVITACTLSRWCHMCSGGDFTQAGGQVLRQARFDSLNNNPYRGAALNKQGRTTAVHSCAPVGSSAKYLLVGKSCRQALATSQRAARCGAGRGLCRRRVGSRLPLIKCTACRSTASCEVKLI